MSGSLALAGRLLFTGVRRPRAAMRAALAAGPGEAWRLGVTIASAVPIILADRSVRAAIAEQYAVAADQYPGTHSFAVGTTAFAVLVIVVVVIAYIAFAITISAILALTRWARPSFATLRSIVAVASWIGVIPVTAAVAIYGVLWPTATSDPSWPSVSGLLPSVVYVPYFALCIGEAFGIPAARSVIVSAISNIGLNLLFGLAAAAPKLLNAQG